MKTFIQRLLRAFQDAQQRRADERALAELDPRTLRDIGYHDAAEQTRFEALRRRVHFGLY